VPVPGWLDARNLAANGDVSDWVQGAGGCDRLREVAASDFCTLIFGLIRLPPLENQKRAARRCQDHDDDEPLEPTTFSILCHNNVAWLDARTVN
jgi:hypothetical protein